MSVEEIYKEFLKNNKVMQLATQDNGRLWLCTVYFASDDIGNIYWTSGRNRRHSVEIEKNPVVAATVVNDQERKQAVQISGKAYRIPVAESGLPHEVYGNKLGQKDDRLDEVRQDKPDSRAYWVLKPEFIELWDEVNFPNSPKQAVQIS